MPKCRSLLCAVLTLIWALPTVLRAEVYRCQVEGRTVFTDRPCAAGATPHDLPPLGRIPAGEASDLVEAYDERRSRARESRSRDNARWLEQYHDEKAQAERFEAAIRDHRTLKGMTPDHVRRALGSPDEIDRGSGTETWFYGIGKKRRTVVFADGQLRTDRGGKR